MFQKNILNYFVRGLTKTSNKKKYYINNSMLYNKNINNIIFNSENKTRHNITYNKYKKKIEFQESHSNYGYIIDKLKFK